MANPLKGEARLGDATLTFNFGTLCELEEKTGKRVPELLASMANGLGFSELRDFVWAGLQVDARGATDADAAALLDEHGFKAGTAAVAKAVNAFFGDQRGKDKNPPKAR